VSNFLTLVELSTPHGALGTYPRKENDKVRSLLSTPHGALGTSQAVQSFPIDYLSTPHGALGTFIACVYSRAFASFNSTRCIRNPCVRLFLLRRVRLSTPHGALGTTLRRT